MITTNTIIAVPNKFAPKVFNRLAYNQKISRSFITSSLLG